MVYFVFNFPPDSPLNVCDPHFQSDFINTIALVGIQNWWMRYAVETTPE